MPGLSSEAKATLPESVVPSITAVRTVPNRHRPRMNFPLPLLRRGSLAVRLGDIAR